MDTDRGPRQNGDSLERELKFAGVELDALRERLIDMEAERQWASALEENWIFDRDGELRDDDRYLRLRKDTRGARITYKGPTGFEGRLKVRTEHETPVGDVDEMRRILEALGYELTRRYQKKREQWRLGGVSISLDHTPIGDFAEFEGEAAEALAKRCGFDPNTSERRSYLRLYEDHLVDHPNDPPDMVFPD